MKFRIVTNGEWYQVQHKCFLTLWIWRDSWLEQIDGSYRCTSKPDSPYSLWHKLLKFSNPESALDQINKFKWRALENIDDDDPRKMIYYEEALKELR